MNTSDFAEDFIKSAIKAEKLSHAIVLTGEDSFRQYELALKTAKLLNCQNRSFNPDLPEHKCTCLNCSWIDQNRHPSVITISPIDFTHANDKSKKMEVISVETARYLRNELGISSSYHRVVIFTNAVEGKEYEKDYANRLSVGRISFSPPVPTDREFKDDEIRNSWMPLPLNHKVLQSAAVNTLLKTLEEPGKNITFFFLTRDREDLIETIISRCQVLPVVSEQANQSIMIPDADFLEDIFPKDYSQALNFSQKLEQIAKDEGFRIEDLLSIMQENIRKNVHKNAENSAKIRLFSKMIEKIEITKTRLKYHVSPTAALDTLFISMI